MQDIVDGLVMAMNSGIKNDVFNLGTGEDYDLNEMVSILNEYFGTAIEPKYVENKIKNYVPSTLADTTKAQKVLGFKAKNSLRDGIKKYL